MGLALQLSIGQVRVYFSGVLSLSLHLIQAPSHSGSQTSAQDKSLGCSPAMRAQGQVRGRPAVS